MEVAMTLMGLSTQREEEGRAALVTSVWRQSD